MEAKIDANTGDEVVIEQTYVEGFGLRSEVFGFNSHVGGDQFSLNLDLAKTDAFVKKLADAFINQTEVELTIVEGPISMVWTDVTVDSMYGFKSFGCSTKAKPTMV